MNFWRVMCGLVASACVVGTCLLVPVQGQDKNKEEDFLKLFKAFNYNKDKPASFYQKLVTNTTQAMKVEKQGQPEMKQVQTQTFIIKWTPKEKKDSNYVVEQQIVYVDMNIMIGTTNIGYKSDAKEQPKNPMTEFFDSLMSVKLTLYINDKDLTVKKVEGGEEFVKKLGESHPQMKNLLKSILSDEALMKMAQQTWGAIPTTAKAPGATWSTESDLNLGAIGMYKNKYDYKYDSYDAKDETDKFTVTPSMSYVPPSKEKSELPFDIKDAGKDKNLKSVAGAESTGTVFFSRKTGRISKSSMKMKVEGTVVISIGGTDTDVRLDQTQSSELATFDTEAEAKK